MVQITTESRCQRVLSDLNSQSESRPLHFLFCHIQNYSNMKLIIIIVFKQFIKWQQEKMKELWDNQEDEAWEKY